MRLFVLFALLFLPACVSYRLAPPLAWPLSSRAVLVFDEDFDAGERLELAAELDFAERLYLGLEGGSSPRVARVTLHNGGRLPRGLTEGAGLRTSSRRRYLGMCRWGWAGATIDLGVGFFGRIAAATHELHHARHGDPEHARPGWRKVNGLRYASR